MHNVSRAILLALFFCSALTATCFGESRLAFKDWFGENTGTFVLHDPANDTYVIHNMERAKTALSPHSTFKIPHSVIAIENGIITDTNAVVPWDSKKHPPESTWTPDLYKAWAKPHSIVTAFQNSAIWFYQDIAEKVGKKRMGDSLKRFDYGNQDISGKLTSFWLNSSLQISALEQVQFLERFYFHQIGANPDTIERVKQIMVIDDTPKYRLSVKTGLGPIGSEHPLAWYVGFIEVKQTPQTKPYFFALNIEGGSAAEISQHRKTITLNALKALGLMPSN